LNTIVLEQTEMGDIPLDVYQKLSNDRILFITGDVDEKIATDICATLLLKSHEDEEKKITLFINSNGGNIRDVFMIYDMMQMIDAPLETVCVGSAADEVAILLAAGEPGMRLATKNSLISVGQLEHRYGMHANMVDAKKYMHMTEEDNKRYLSVIAETTGKDYKQVTQDFDRRVFMNASRALKYGLIDKIVKVNK
jgi:ATP-dependent Clp protease, protease subunit